MTFQYTCCSMHRRAFWGDERVCLEILDAYDLRIIADQIMNHMVDSAMWSLHSLPTSLILSMDAEVIQS